MSVHFIEKCECGTVISQCRCPGPKTERRGVCKECKKKGIMLPKDPASFEYPEKELHEKLLNFAAALLMPGDMIWNKDGEDIEAAGLKSGLVVKTQYDPKEHGEELGEEWDLDPGCDINQVIEPVVEWFEKEDRE